MTLERAVLSKLKPYTPGKSIVSVMREKGITDVIKLASNENPLGSPVTSEDLQEIIAQSHIYPHPMESKLIGDLADFYAVTPESIILGNGSDEVLQMVAATFLSPGDEMLTSRHTFSVYEMVATLFDAETISVPMKGWSYDLDSMLSSVTERTKVVFIANPNNPTGQLLSTEALRSFLSQLPSHVVTVIDEAYGEFVTDESYVSAIHLVQEFPRLVATRTFSKLYGLAGLRIGYGVAQPELLYHIQKVRPPFNVNGIALKAAEIALSNRTFVSKSLEMVQSGIDQFKERLQFAPVSILETQANFLCIQVQGHLADDICSFLLDSGIIVRSLRSFGFLDCIRVTVGTSKQNERFLHSFLSYLEDCSHAKERIS